MGTSETAAPARRFVAGNWKMNGGRAALVEVEALAAALAEAAPACRVALFPPATLIASAAERLQGSAIEVGAQDCHAKSHGAFTGDLSAELLAEAGARLVILGHSERRALHHETDAEVAAKVRGALRGGLEPVVCVGESMAERQAGRALEVVAAQVRASLPDALQGRAFSVAYEPVWAIGSGKTPKPREIEEVHAAIHAILAERFGAGAAQVLYGGSVRGDNAAEIMAIEGVDGALVGGASLKAADFLPIVRAD